MIKIPQEVRKEIGERAKNFRKREKLTQAELAEKSGVSLASLKRFEQTGQVSLDSLLKIAFALDALDHFDQLFTQTRQLPKSLDEILKNQKKP